MTAPICGARTWVDAEHMAVCSLDDAHDGETHVDPKLGPWRRASRCQIRIGHGFDLYNLSAAEARDVMERIQRQLHALDPATTIADAERKMLDAVDRRGRLVRVADLYSDSPLDRIEAAAEEAKTAQRAAYDAWHALVEARDAQGDAAGQGAAPDEWLVVIHRDTKTSATIFSDEQGARDFFATASEQWSESYLARAVIGPGPGFEEERAACDRAAFKALSEQAEGDAGDPSGFLEKRTGIVLFLSASDAYRASGDLVARLRIAADVIAPPPEYNGPGQLYQLLIAAADEIVRLSTPPVATATRPHDTPETV